MFRNILIGTALTLAAATPAFAQAVPHNYPDRCKTAFENYKQAQWEKSHQTAQGNLGGAEGWEELADAADKSAAKQTARAAEHAAEAQKHPPGSDSANFWNGQATIAAGEAKEWKDSAKSHRANAKKMRGEAWDYEAAALKALLECLNLLNVATVNMVPSYGDVVISDKPVEETTATAEQPEKKPKKKPVRKTQKPEKKPKVAKVKKPATATQTAADSIAREVFVNVATGLILGQINGHGLGNGHKHKKHHKAKHHQMQEGHAMGNGKSHRKMKKNKRMSSMF